MAAPRTKVEISAVYKALKVNGETGTPAKQFLDLIFKIEQLGDKQQIVRAGDLTDEHIGMQVETPSGKTGILSDIDMTTVGLYGPYRGQEVARRAMINGSEDEDFDQVETPSPLYGTRNIPQRHLVTIVIDSKLKRIHRNALLILTELRDI